jgi:hypothetical protein
MRRFIGHEILAFGWWLSSHGKTITSVSVDWETSIDEETDDRGPLRLQVGAQIMRLGWWVAGNGWRQVSTGRLRAN